MLKKYLLLHFILTAQFAFGSPILFTESRETPIRRVDILTEKWRSQNQSALAFKGTAHPGEYYVFQVGIYEDSAQPVTLKFSEFKSATNAKAAIHCINFGGIGNDGKPMKREVQTMPGKITPLWIAVDLPQDAKGVYRGYVQVGVGELKRNVAIELNVSGEALKDHGDSVGKNLSRLRWLDSKAGEGDTVLSPYTAMSREKNTIHLLGRSVTIGEQGMPEKITSTFSNSNTHTNGAPREYLAAPMRLDLQLTNGEKLSWKLTSFGVKNTLAVWSATGESPSLRCVVNGKMDYTGSGEIKTTLTAKSAVKVGNFALVTPIRSESAKYAVGLSESGGFFKKDVDWKWSMPKNAQNGIWLGDVNVGMALKLKDKTWHRPLVNVYYKFWPLENPIWANGGKGGWKVKRSETIVESMAYTGDYDLAANESIEYGAEFFVTPFHPLETDAHWQRRFYHDEGQGNQAGLEAKIATINASEGSPNIYNVHHAGFVVPFINYPMADENIEVFKDFVKKVHDRKASARVYYTTRELTGNLPELFALHALQGEAILPSRGKPVRGELNQTVPEFLDQNLKEEFIAAWPAGLPKIYANGKDCSVLTTPDGRFDNFYLGGLEWMVKNVGIDGIYIDDTALNARSLQRARRIMQENNCKGPLVDFHSWNTYHGWGSFLPNMVHYMDVLPHMDCFWMGEGYNANGMTPDAWLVMASGMPFGIMGEMLDGPNPWKGLVFGAVARRKQGDSISAWKAYDRYGMAGTQMILFADPANPFKTGNEQVLATVFKGKKRSLVAVANWNSKKASIEPDIDWASLGLDPNKACLYAPEMEGIQKERIWKPGEKINISPGRGYFLVLDEEKREVAPAIEVGINLKLRTIREDDFSAPTLPQEWIVTEQKENATLQHTAGKVVLKASANHYVGMALALPAGVSAVQSVLHPGNEQGQDWGVGMALVWSNQKSLRFNLRMGDDKFGVYTPDKLEFFPGLNKKADNIIRILLTNNEFIFQYQNGADEWETLATYPRGEGMEGDPMEIRIGKANRPGNWVNHGEAGAMGECMIKKVLIQGL